MRLSADFFCLLSQAGAAKNIFDQANPFQVKSETGFLFQHYLGFLIPFLTV